MKPEKLIHLTKSLVLAFLIAFPPVYQSLHQVFSHHQHFTCCERNSNEVQQPEDECGVVGFIFHIQEDYSFIPLVGFPVEQEVIIKVASKEELHSEFTGRIDIRGPPFSC